MKVGTSELFYAIIFLSFAPMIFASELNGLEKITLW